jgi:hypothetical protein
MTDEQSIEPTTDQIASPVPEPAPERGPFVPGADQLREAMKARMPPIHPAGYSEPIPDVARIAGGLVAHVARGGPPVINPATPPDPEALAAMQAQADRERAAMAARDAATAPPTLEERVARLEATVARLTSR